MSMNIYLRATITATLPNGQPKEFIGYCDLWQTPTYVTDSILSELDKFEAYKKWVKGLKSPEGKSHIKNVKYWIWEKGYEGWELEWFSM